MLKEQYRILITGSCGVTSRSVVRSLKLSRFFESAVYIGCDICENSYGIYEGLYDKTYKVPGYNSNEYISAITSIIKKEQIDAAIIIPELEVLVWAKNNFPVKYIVPPYDFSKWAINKAVLYEKLQGTGVVPSYQILNRQSILNNNLNGFNEFPCWIRDFSSGTTSGKGALKIDNPEEAKAWVVINKNIDEFMFTEYLPGGNFACHLLYNEGEVIKIACYERLKYFMSRVAPSGITGNIAEGRLVNNDQIVEVSKLAVDTLSKLANVTMNGIVAIDLKANEEGKPYITEINIRHVAATSAFASAGFNIAEQQLLLALGEYGHLDPQIEKQYSPVNRIFRDIDGLPIWIKNYKELKIGESI